MFAGVHSSDNSFIWADCVRLSVADNPLIGEDPEKYGVSTTVVTVVRLDIRNLQMSLA